MAAKLCKEEQIYFGNRAKYSDFIDGKYFKNVEEQVILLQSKLWSNF